ncbi:MAG TPA: hypothetical protein VKE94_02210 [Gemmataceae bacterium]|nr:hypothetical protein [Gemmataceae bacterium]
MNSLQHSDARQQSAANPIVTLMKLVLRPGLLLVISLASVVVAAGLVYWTPAPEARPEPKPVQPGDREIVFLYQATAASTWQRFVEAAKHLRGWRNFQVDDGNAFPRETTAVPELVVSSGSAHGRLIFRWYKLTSTQRAADWMDALLRRSPPPLAIVGGNTSDAAWEQATELQRAARQLPEEQRPLLLLTTATAQNVGEPSVALTQIYPGRTFRFCFTNQQMAEAVTEFLDGQEELQVDKQRIYTAAWEDDSYSSDLTASFGTAVVRGGAPPEAAGQRIPSSIGLFDRPNEDETKAAGWLIDDFRKNWGPAGTPRPLLVVAGQSQPSRRFLRALNVNLAAWERRFVVATGDTLSFNTIYRDRNTTWPIQDLPFSLLFFCHRNPVSADSGFSPDASSDRSESASNSGTEDLLLFKDLVRALLHSTTADGAELGDAATVTKRLSALRRSDVLDNATSDAVLFDEDGNRRTGTGEHVVWLEPTIDDSLRVLPKATITVWSRQVDGTGGERWMQRRKLAVLYESPSGEPGHGGD